MTSNGSSTKGSKLGELLSDWLSLDLSSLQGKGFSLKMFDRVFVRT